MAYTIVDTVKRRLDKSINYAINPQKTCIDENGKVGATLEEVAQNPKIKMLATAINCQSPLTAYAEMCATKERYKKLDKVKGFTYIQSFPTGSVSPEQAHEIGVEFARRCFGGRFEVVVGTHLNTQTIHNHIVINSVSFADGCKYRSNKSEYFNRVIAISEEVSRSYGLPAGKIPKGKSPHYAEWKAEKEGKQTLRGILRTDIDEAIRASYTFQSFVAEMKHRGHTININPNRKYITIQPRGGERFFRLTEKSMGKGYSEENIKSRLARQRDGLPEEPRNTAKTTAKPRRRFSDAAAFKPRKHRKMKGFVALYWHYLYFLKVVKHGGKQDKLPFSVRQDITKLEQYTRQFLYLYRNNISTSEELQAHRQGLEKQITTLTDERRPLYTERRNATEQEQMAALSKTINEKTAALRKLRKDKRLCDVIEKLTPEVTEKIRQAEELIHRQEKEHLKEKDKQEKFKLL